MVRVCAVRVMAQRWLYERRWEGHASGTDKDPEAKRRTSMRARAGELAQLRQLRTVSPADRPLDAQIARLEKQLRALRGG